jgi:hypothetical protein
LFSYILLSYLGIPKSILTKVKLHTPILRTKLIAGSAFTSSNTTFETTRIQLCRRGTSQILRLTRWWTPKESSEKMEGRGGGEAQWVVDQKTKKSRIVSANFRNHKNSIGIIVTRLSANVD